MRTPVSVGVVGLGRWGPELARAFDDLPQAELRWLCDKSGEAQLRVKARHVGARVTADLDDLLNDETLDAVVVATPAGTHFELARRALQGDKHVFVEQPLALNGEQADALVHLAERHNRRLLVGHVVPFHPAVRKLKELIELGRLGDLYYLYANRQDIAQLSSEEDLVWKLGGPAVSALLYLVGDEPVEVSARAESYIRPGEPDVAFCFLRFATGITAHLHLSWLDPLKLNRMAVVGSKRMAVFDHLDPERQLTVHAKSAAAVAGTHAVHVRHGEIVSPRISNEEPLRLQCEHFLTTIRSPVDPAAARQGAAVVNVLEALTRSTEQDGAPTPVRGCPRPEARVVRLPVRAPTEEKREGPLDQSEATPPSQRVYPL
jgi:predicted dehydrogenase